MDCLTKIFLYYSKNCQAEKNPIQYVIKYEGQRCRIAENKLVSHLIVYLQVSVVRCCYTSVGCIEDTFY